MNETHAELKILKAELIRQKFEEFFNSEDFRLLSLENDIDTTFKQASSEINRVNRERNINTYIYILNYLLYNWIHEDPDSNSSKSYYNNFVFFLDTIILGYYSHLNKPFDYSKIINCLNKISMLEKSDIDKIESKLKTLNEEKTKELEKLKLEVKEITSNKVERQVENESLIEYAIITALEDDEMEKILPFINKLSEVENTNNYIEIGELKDCPQKKVVYASQHNTGMVDASILASELICRFRPKFLIMVGVLGGKPEDTNIGDVIVATKVFEIDRGKITDTGFKKESSVATITNKEIKKISRSKRQIEAHINDIDETRNSEVKIHFGPIACVNQVIDLPGFFNEKITALERKAIALEMESFAIVRACELLNEGKTIPIIIKSVMDNTQSKQDNAKPYAAWTSAKTLEYILKSNII
ncbi:5'-methylthioadenosine/S-adenosylhomocysteine nucleosidase family protein [Flavobacterium sp.]|uniref:5'-methylthioadenosine/S-adenosylhomocysteine nucleosidase family protein n=2 Tax=Flavobacterium sp. TaxID=239 RepID=UPI004047C737